MNELLQTLGETRPFYVRCLRSNSTKSSLKFDEDIILPQLRYSGLLQIIQLKKNAFNYDFTFQEFNVHYRPILPNGVKISFDELKVWLSDSGLDETRCQIGLSKVFLRQEGKLFLDGLLHNRIVQSVEMLQRFFRYSLLRLHFVRMRVAAIVLQTWWRSVMASQAVERIQLRTVAALCIQRWWMGCKTKKLFPLRRIDSRKKKQDLQVERERKLTLEIYEPSEIRRSSSVPNLPTARSRKRSERMSPLRLAKKRLHNFMRLRTAEQTASQIEGDDGDNEIRGKSKTKKPKLSSLLISYFGDGSGSRESHKIVKDFSLLQVDSSFHPRIGIIFSSTSKRKVDVKGTVESSATPNLKLQEVKLEPASPNTRRRRLPKDAVRPASPLGRVVKDVADETIPSEVTSSTDVVKGILIRETPLPKNNIHSDADTQFPASSSAASTGAVDQPLTNRSTDENANGVGIVATPEDVAEHADKRATPNPLRSSWRKAISGSFDSLANIGIIDDNAAAEISVNQNEAVGAAAVAVAATASPSAAANVAATSPIAAAAAPFVPAAPSAAPSSKAKPPVPSNRNEGQHVKTRRLLRRLTFSAESKAATKAGWSPNRKKPMAIKMQEERSSVYDYDVEVNDDAMGVDGSSARPSVSSSSTYRSNRSRQISQQLSVPYYVVEESDSKEFSLSSTSEWKYPETVVIHERVVLDNFVRFIFEKIVFFSTIDSGDKRDTSFDNVFEVALKEFHSNLISSFSVQTSNKGLSIRYKDLMTSFEQILKAKAQQMTPIPHPASSSTTRSPDKRKSSSSFLTTDKSSLSSSSSSSPSLTGTQKRRNSKMRKPEDDAAHFLCLNAFRGFLDEFLKISMEEHKAMDAKHTKAERALVKQRKREENIEKKKKNKIKQQGNKENNKEEKLLSLYGHQFLAVSFSIPTFCEICSSLIWMLKEGYVCQVCKFTCHLKCSARLTSQCKGTGLSARAPDALSSSSSGDTLSTFGVALDRLVSKEETVPVIVHKLIQSIEFNGLYTVGIYRKPGSIVQIKSIRALIDETGDLSSISFTKFNVTAIASALKSFFRELPEPVTTYKLYHDFVRCMDLVSLKERLAALYAVVGFLPRIYAETFQRVVMHLARIASHESSNLMSPNGLAIIFAPVLLRTKEPLTAQASLAQVARQTECLEILIEDQKLRLQDSLVDLESISSTVALASRRLSTIRNSKKSVSSQPSLHERKTSADSPRGIDSPSSSMSGSQSGRATPARMDSIAEGSTAAAGSTLDPAPVPGGVGVVDAEEEMALMLETHIETLNKEKRDIEHRMALLAPRETPRNGAVSSPSQLAPEMDDIDDDDARSLAWMNSSDLDLSSIGYADDDSISLRSLSTSESSRDAVKLDAVTRRHVYASGLSRKFSGSRDRPSFPTTPEKEEKPFVEE